jgi:hypothetical protein
MTNLSVRCALAVMLASWAMGCSSDSDDGKSDPCSVEAQTGCAEGLVCQAVSGGEPACFCNVEAQTGCGEGLACESVEASNSACFAPVVVKGRVFDMADDAGVEGAHVLARDANNAAASGVAVTDVEGHYSLAVPTPRKADGTPVVRSVTLRADAAGYLGFPKAPRVALPVTIDTASVESDATDIGLTALESTAGLGSVSGKVVAALPWGTLVLAGAQTAVADRDGSFTVFNVPAGSVTVSGYKVGLKLDTAVATVKANEAAEGVVLESLGEAVAVISGSVQIVNAFGGAKTSVILALEETFDENAARGEAPPGLRVGNVTGSFSIAGVPDGRYVVLAAFENDRLVRDPDTSIGGTTIVRVTVAGSDQALSEGFKVTEALEVVAPDAEQEVTGKPTFEWKDDSGEDHYEVRVFDAFGQKVWEKLDVPGVSGNSNVTAAYGGPALTAGTLYQFRATSIKKGGTPISVTEDLRGVFVQR